MSESPSRSYPNVLVHLRASDRSFAGNRIQRGLSRVLKYAPRVYKGIVLRHRYLASDAIDPNTPRDDPRTNRDRDEGTDSFLPPCRGTAGGNVAACATSFALVSKPRSIHKGVVSTLHWPPLAFNCARGLRPEKKYYSPPKSGSDTAVRSLSGSGGPDSGSALEARDRFSLERYVPRYESPGPIPETVITWRNRVAAGISRRRSSALTLRVPLLTGGTGRERSRSGR